MATSELRAMTVNWVVLLSARTPNPGTEDLLGVRRGLPCGAQFSGGRSVATDLGKRIAACQLGPRFDELLTKNSALLLCRASPDHAPPLLGTGSRSTVGRGKRSPRAPKKGASLPLCVAVHSLAQNRASTSTRMIGVDRCNRTRKLTAPTGGTLRSVRRPREPPITRRIRNAQEPVLWLGAPSSPGRHPRAGRRTAARATSRVRPRDAASPCTHAAEPTQMLEEEALLVPLHERQRIVPSVSTSAPSGTDSINRKRGCEFGRYRSWTPTFPHRVPGERSQLGVIQHHASASARLSVVHSRTRRDIVHASSHETLERLEQRQSPLVLARSEPGEFDSRGWRPRSTSFNP